MASKATRPKTPVDKIIDLGIDKRKIYGILRKQTKGGVAVIAGTGGGAIQITGSPAGSNLLNSDNLWLGNNIFDGGICIRKMSCDMNANGKRIENLASPVQCGDAVNKCYVDALLAAAGFNQGLITESLSESPFIFYNQIDKVYSQNENTLQLKTLTEIGEVCLSCFYDATPVDPTPLGGLKATQNSTLNDDFTVTFVTINDYLVTEQQLGGISIMPAAYWSTTQNWYVDNALQGTVSIDGVGHFSFDFDPSGFSLGDHELEIGTSTPRAKVSFVV